VSLSETRYARFGVQELWVVASEAETVTILNGTPVGFVEAGAYRPGETLRSPMLAGLEIAVAEIF
jgi:Uma2 family endonuclease